MTLRRDEAGSFLVVEAILVAVMILTAILFFTSVQRPTASTEARGIDLGQVATDTLGIVQKRVFTSPSVRGDPEDWVTKVIGGDTVAAGTVDDFLNQVLPTGSKHFVRLSNGVATIPLLPTSNPGNPQGARAAEVPFFPHWQPGASNPLPTAASSYVSPGVEVTSGSVAYQFTDPATMACIKGPNGSTLGPTGAAWASSTYWKKSLGQVPPWALYGVWTGYPVTCGTAPVFLAVTIPGTVTLDASLSGGTSVSCTGAGDCSSALIGRLVLGTGIPAGTTVTAVNAPGSTMTISQAATQSGPTTLALVPNPSYAMYGLQLVVWFGA